MYLIVITRKRNVGSLLGHSVWKAVDFDVISYKKTVLHLSEIQVSRTHSASDNRSLEKTPVMHETQIHFRLMLVVVLGKGFYTCI